MGLFDGIDTLLELAEAYANETGEGYASEDELSVAFDDEIAPSIVKEYGKDDEPAMSEAFNNWTDMLTKDGDLHAAQYNEYCYVGEYASED